MVSAISGQPCYQGHCSPIVAMLQAGKRGPFPQIKCIPDHQGQTQQCEVHPFHPRTCGDPPPCVEDPAKNFQLSPKLMLQTVALSIFSVCLFRNKDFQEVTLEKDGETVLRFAAAYGFRNIQNMVLKLKKGKCSYHFIEVLACPGGNNKS